MGDNVVWQAASPADVEPFLAVFLATANGATSLTYLSFRLPPSTVLDRFGRVWDSERFTLLDGWTGGRDARRGRRKGATAFAPLLGRVRRLKDPADPEQVNRELAEITDELGPGAGYVFDDIEVRGRAAGTREPIGFQVRAGRLAAGLSQAELARRIGVTPAPCPRSSGAATACRARP